MRSFTDAEAARWAKLEGWGDPRWGFAVMPHNGQRWLWGSRGCGQICFPMINLDSCPHATLDAARRAFFESGCWKEVELRASREDGVSPPEEIARFDAAQEQMARLRRKLAKTDPLPRY